MSNKLLLLTISSHNFKITRISPNTKIIVDSFARRYIQRGMVKQQGRFVTEAVKVFAAATSDREEYRFHINQLKDFYEHLKFNHVTENLYEIINNPIKPGTDIELKVKDKWVLRDYQIPVSEYLIETNYNRAKFVGLQPGEGKTAISLISIAELRKRTVIIIKPMFIEKWVEDIVKTYDIDLQDIMVVRGSAHLMALLDQAKDGDLECKFIIISNKTIQNWIKIHELYRDGAETLGYSSKPETLIEDLGCGIRLIDEAHMDFHLCFKIDLYTNVERSISLSATLVSNDDFITRMHEIMHPSPTRYVAQKIKQYINSYVVYYNFEDPTKVRTTEYGATNYSHTALEKSIYKHKPTLTNYLNLINYTIQIGFVKNLRVKKKLLIFASTIEMCGMIVEYLEKLYPEYNVKRYVAEDSYEDNLMKSDICVSTLGSAGTAVDIPNLTNVILTVAVDSIQSNIQSLGRLRQLGSDDKTEFHYFTCLDFPKHLEYSYRKKEMLSRYAKTFSEIYSRHIV